MCSQSAVDPAAAAGLPALELVLTEPQRDFLLGALHRVAAVDHVPATQSGAQFYHTSTGYSINWL